MITRNNLRKVINLYMEGKSINEIFQRVIDKVKKEYRTDSFILKGNNWLNNKDLPIAVCIGFNPWKRDIIWRYLSNYRVVFLKGNASWMRFENDFLLKYKIDDNITIVKWGNNNLSRRTQRWINQQNKEIKILSIEDGFLRSIGNGLLHTKPASLCIDDKTIYFNANEPSQIENLLSIYDFQSDSVLMEQAVLAKKLIKDASLTKYYDINSADENVRFKRRKNYSILVIGQVEDDASIKYGKSKITLNTKLVKQARKEYPDADIYFRPHPDYINNNRKSISNIKTIENIAVILPNDIPLTSILDNIDHVYTMTSLVGMEALVRGLKVTTFGLPFYAGWGLTDDRVSTNRRKRKLSIDELIAGVYLLYPKYLHIYSDEEISFQETASYFIFELLKDKNIFSIDEESKLFQSILSYIDKLSIPLQVMQYLNTTKINAAADSKKILQIIEKNFSLVDYIQISEILIKTSNYDVLVTYSNYCIEYVKENITSIINNSTLLDSFLYSLSISLRNSNGRTISQLPDLSDYLFLLPSSDSKTMPIFKNYLTCLSHNLQYDQIITFIDKISNKKQNHNFENLYWTLDDYITHKLVFTPNLNFYKMITSIMQQKPSRSERDINARHQILYSSASTYLQLLDEKYNTNNHYLFNKALYYALLNEIEEMETFLNKFYQKVEIKNIYRFIEKNNRTQEFISLNMLLLKKKRFELPEKFIQANSDLKYDESFTPVFLSFYKNQDRSLYYSYIEKLPYEIQESDKVATMYARTLREDGFFSASLKKYEKLYFTAKTLARKHSLSQEISKLKFIIESSKILNSVSQPKLPNGVVFIASQTCFNTMAMMIPSLVEVKKKGYAVVCLTEGMLEKTPTNIKTIDQFEGIIPLDLTMSGGVHDLKNSWEIDWQNKKVICDGINYYQGFYERISTSVRRYFININAKHCYNEFIQNLVRADTCLYVCKMIYSEIVQQTNIPVTFISGNSHVVPYSIFRDFSMNKNHDRLGFINCNVAYESYFSNVGSKFASTMAVTDMTLYPTIRAPFMARKDKFDIWYEKNKENKKYLKIAQEQINVNRVGSTSNKRELEIIDFLKKEKLSGKKIVCAFGKVPVDLNVPFDGGPAHKDMADWINHTVKICGKDKDIILLVKPHPHELKPEIALDLVESFHDLITEEVQDNIYLLGHKDINGHALAPYLDLAVLYNGSTALELTAQGIPVMLTSYFGKYDYPVELNYPENREDYEHFLLSKKYPKPSEAVKQKSAFLISYLGTEEVSTLNLYSKRQLTNDKVGIPIWDKKRITHFLKEGDKNMTKIAEQIVEKFEKENKS